MGDWVAELVAFSIMSALLVILLIGATVRLTRLFTTDYLFEPVRARIEKRLPGGSTSRPNRLAYLIRCDWCVSPYIGLAVFVAGWYAPEAPVIIVSGALTASLLAGLSSIVEVAIEG